VRNVRDRRAEGASEALLSKDLALSSRLRTVVSLDTASSVHNALCKTNVQEVKCRFDC